MRQRILGGILVPFIAGCSLFVKQNAAPVVELGYDKSISHGMHVVQRGETLYQIAWRYGRDFKDIALANHIDSPYTIYPGQKISLSGGRSNNSQQASKQERANVQAQKSFAQPVEKIAAGKQFKNDWVWPVHGKIIKHYQSQGVGLKGIDLSGRLGTPIKAAASGKVVYSGHGLRGYGQLIIIKHNDIYLSAYGHNNRLLVNEGQAVSKGQVIAEMGRSDAEQVKLHFEIRKNGRPINPLDLLPTGAA